MAQPVHILYISGLGDNYDAFRLRCLKLWRYKNVTVELVPMKWREGTFEQKIARIDQAINRAKGKRIVLIGESAGGSMAIHTYARRADDLYRVMTLCGKNKGAEKVSQRLYDANPAFLTSMHKLQAATDELTTEQKHDFVSIHPIADETVPVSETLLDGCRQIRLWTFGHILTIAIAITILSPILVRTANVNNETSYPCI